MCWRSGADEPPENWQDHEPDHAQDQSPGAAGLFCALHRSQLFRPAREDAMPNHLTPDELAKETGIDREEVIRICIEEGVPIYHGKIDKTLFQASLEAVGTAGSSAQA
jgi:hypothetical protein